MKADKLPYPSPSLATHMIMKSEIKTEEEEEENNHGIQQRHEKNVPDKLGPVSNPSLPISSLPSYYLNGMQSIARLGRYSSRVPWYQAQRHARLNNRW
jgi:hypothetical protein